MKTKGATITVDDETIRIVEKLAKRFNKSIPDMIKDLVKREDRLAEFKITRGVKKISGLLKTDFEYDTLKDMCIADRMVKYESLD